MIGQRVARAKVRKNAENAFAASGRILAPEQVTAAAAYWVGDESRSVSGTVLELEQYPVIGRNPVKG